METSKLTRLCLTPTDATFLLFRRLKSRPPIRLSTTSSIDGNFPTSAQPFPAPYHLLQKYSFGAAEGSSRECFDSLVSCSKSKRISCLELSSNSD
jgi:hypothetical protein